ncbi:HAD family hydrolase [Lawsonibacter faecis]|uniref:HAD-IA family hydrolase n=1 Tax=Lawsonibacter faecis TaxID=2763052 RepID=A0A8J6MHB1_9FIRM|nr:HAD-IA family hydrolase [Lawsonibacter faecis]MBC5738408.1 HAD-IA family hydrolase [Lawsonibacter faecis]
MKLKAVLFDFDYTLGDATESIVAGFQYAFGKMGLTPPGREAVRPTVGYLLRDGYVMLSGDTDEARADEFVRLFAEKSHPMQLETTVLFPGALELLRALRGAGIKVGVVSSKRSTALLPLLEKLELSPLMDFVMAGDMVSRPKPDPEGLNLALERLGIDREEVLFCGDTVLDAEAAQRAGTHFAAVLNGITPAGAFEAFPYDHIAPDLAELKSWLEES